MHERHSMCCLWSPPPAAHNETISYMSAREKLTHIARLVQNLSKQTKISYLLLLFFFCFFSHSLKKKKEAAAASVFSTFRRGSRASDVNLLGCLSAVNVLKTDKRLSVCVSMREAFEIF